MMVSYKKITAMRGYEAILWRSCVCVEITGRFNIFFKVSDHRLETKICDMESSGKLYSADE